MALLPGRSRPRSPRRPAPGRPPGPVRRPRGRPGGSTPGPGGPPAPSRSTITSASSRPWAAASRRAWYACWRHPGRQNRRGRPGPGFAANGRPHHPHRSRRSPLGDGRRRAEFRHVTKLAPIDPPGEGPRHPVNVATTTTACAGAAGSSTGPTVSPGTSRPGTTGTTGTTVSGRGGLDTEARDAGRWRRNRLPALNGEASAPPSGPP